MLVTQHLHHIHFYTILSIFDDTFALSGHELTHLSIYIYINISPSPDSVSLSLQPAYIETDQETIGASQ